MKRFTHSVLFLLLLPLVPLFCTGCNRTPDTPAAAPVTKCDLTSGACVFRVKVSQDSLQLSDILHLTVEAEAPEGLSVDFQDFTPDAEQFSVCGFQDAVPRLAANGQMAYSRTYELELLIADKYEIPALTCRFGNEKNDGTYTDLTTEPFSLDVVLPDENYWSHLDIDDKTGMTPFSRLHACRFGWPFVLLGLLLAAAMISALLWLCKRRKNAATPLPPPLPPHVTALRRLDELLAANLPSKGKFKEFYQDISDILRTYIEARFDVHAPEQTTEEFLHNLSDVRSPLSAHHDKLKRFLDFCDLVKFAEHEPTSDDIDHTTDSCRLFITDTKQEERQD